MDDLGSYRFVDGDGRALPAGFLPVPVECIKGQGHESRRVYRGVLASKPVLIKVGGCPGVSRRLAALIGTSPLHREARFLGVAQRAGFHVPHLVAYGRRRTFGLPVAEALVTAFLVDHVHLMDCYESAADSAAIGRVREVFVGILARVREAGLCNLDFGLRQVMMPAGRCTVEDAVLLDLEAMRYSRRDDPRGTAAMSAGAVISWWVATRGDETSLAVLYELIRRRLPEPRGGWPAAAALINERVARRMPKQYRKKRIDRAPPPLRWS